MVHLLLPLCPTPATVTSSILDSALYSRDEYLSRKNFQPNFSTQQKNLCYYAGLILLFKILFFEFVTTLTQKRELSAVKLTGFATS